MLGSESRGEVAVDIQLSYHFSINKYWHYDFRLGFQGTRQIARILADIVDHDGLTAGRCRTANSLIERNARVRGHSALERAEHQHRRVRARVADIKHYPRIFHNALS